MFKKGMIVTYFAGTRLERRRLWGISIFLFLSVLPSFGQKFAIRNNLLYDATLTPNLGIEFGIDSLWTVGVNAGLNAWDFNKRKNQKWRHLMVSPYTRHYFRAPFRRAFMGIHGVYIHYNVGNIKLPLDILPKLKDSRVQGDLVALGGSFGYNWRITDHFHLEAEIGMALGYTWYKEYDCATCGAYRGKGDKLLPLPKVGLNLVWTIGRTPAKVVEEVPIIEEVPADTTAEAPVILVNHPVADNAGRAGQLRTDNPVLEHISNYRPYDRTRILRREKGALFVQFPTDKSDLRRNFAQNGPTLDRIVDITRQVLADTTSTVKKIQLVGLASVEGPVDRNERLASDRALALQHYLQQQVPTPDSLYDTTGGGEAWADLRDVLSETIERPSSMTAKQVAAYSEAIRIIDSEPNADVREAKLRRLDGGKLWKRIKDELLPQQRNSGYIRIYYDYVPDKAAAIINKASELLRTDCDDCHRQALAMLQEVRNDERAQNALGVAYYLCGQKEEARTYFEKAAAKGNADARQNLNRIRR